MSLAVFEDVSLSLGGKRIVDDLRLRIAERDRIGLIGPNGSGKTTLLRMITGQQAPDGGSIRARRGLRVGHLPQDMTVEGGSALEAFVVESVPGRAELERELEQAQAELDASEGDEDRLLELGGHIAELTEKLTHFEREFSAHRAQRILTGLGFQDRDFGRDLGELSGGWRMRAVLAALLFQRPDLLLLDEPTNHLDMPSVAWLSGFLRQHPGA
jgi:ATP-binding cassette subfamily F protein 3